MVLLLFLQRIPRTPLFQPAFLGWAQETCHIQTYALELGLFWLSQVWTFQVHKCQQKRNPAVVTELTPVECLGFH